MQNVFSIVYQKEIICENIRKLKNLIKEYFDSCN